MMIYIDATQVTRWRPGEDWAAPRRLSLDRRPTGALRIAPIACQMLSEETSTWFVDLAGSSFLPGVDYAAGSLFLRGRVTQETRPPMLPPIRLPITTSPG